MAASTIALGIISNFATDLIKWAAGTSSAPLEEAISSTATSFPQLEGIEDRLREWLRSPDVSAAVQSFVEGNTGAAGLPIGDLVAAFVERAGFYLPEHSEATARKILNTFFVKVRAAYLVQSPLGALHIANRQEVLFDGMQEKLAEVQNSIETAGGLRPALQTHFEQALSRLEARDFLSAKTLFQSLLTELERAPIRDRNLERRSYASLGHIAAAMGNNDDAVMHYRRAVELDDDPVRKAVNSAVADLNEQKADVALGRLKGIGGVQGSPLVFEYWAAKVHALLRLNRNLEALDAALGIDVSGKEAQKFELVGHVYRTMGDFEAAENAFDSAVKLEPSRPEFQCELAEVLFQPPLAHKNENPGAPIPAHLQEKLERAGKLLESGGSGFRTEGRERAALEAEASLAVVRSLQERFAEAIRLFLPVVTSPFVTANDWRNLGFAYVGNNEPGKAVEAFKNAITEDGSDPTAGFLYAQMLIMTGNAEAALSFAERKASGPITAQNIRWHLTKANALAAKRQFSKAREVLVQVEKEHPDNPEVLTTLAELYEMTGEEANALAAYEKALKNATGADEARLRYMFGGFSARRKEYARAVDLLRPIVRRDTPNTLLDNYVRLLYNSRNLSEITAIVEDLGRAGKQVSAPCAEVAAAAYERLDDAGEATAWLEYLCDNYGNKPEYIARLSGLKLRLGRRDEAVELLDASRGSLQNAEEMIQYAQAYSMLGRHRDAISLGCRAVQLSTTDPDIHMAYVGVFLAAGDQVERTPDEISTYQDVFAKFKERFPDSPHLQSFKVDPERPLDSIRETLARISEQTEDVVKAYRENRMPLQMFATMLGRDLYHVWLQVIADPDLILWTAAGNDLEQLESQRILESATGFMLEPVLLFTFSHLGMLEKLKDLGDLYVAQRALDELHEIQAKRKMLEEHQSATMGMADGQVFMQKITADELRQINLALNAAVEWAETNSTAVGLRAPFMSDDEAWRELIGAGNISSIVSAKQRGYVLLTDDKTLGDIGKQNYGISFVNSQAVLLYLRRKGVLSQEEYDKAVLKLVLAGYTFTRIEEAQLFGVIVEEQFQVTPRLRRVLRVLEPEVLLLPQACASVASLLRRIYLEPIPDTMRQQLAFAILDALAKNHPKLEIQRLVRAFLRQLMGPLLVLQRQAIDELLNRW